MFHLARLLTKISFYKRRGISVMQSIANGREGVNPASGKFTMTTCLPTQTFLNNLQYSASKAESVVTTYDYQILTWWREQTRKYGGLISQM